MPGGTEVSEAAEKNMVMPMPISTSAKRRRRSTGVAAIAAQPFSDQEIAAPSASSMRNMPTLAPTITP